MHVVQRGQRSRRRMNAPYERMVVNGVGLGAVDGFNIGKMFSRLVHVTPRSFQPKNIFGAIGSAAAFTATMGLSSVVAGKQFGAHGTIAKDIGMGISAAAVVVGGVLAAPVVLPVVGSALSSVGAGALSLFGGVAKMFMGGGKGVAPQQQQDQQYGPAYPAGYDPTTGLPLAPMGGQPSYIADPTMYQNPSVANQLTPTVYPSMVDPNADASSAPVDPSQQLVSPSSPYIDTSVPLQQAGMLPNLSTSTWVVLGVLTVGGLYMQFGRKE